MSISLYFDEDVHPSVARILSERGFDILTTQEAEMLGKSDEEQLERAAKEKRAILTFNIGDFVQLSHTWAGEEKEHCGIIVSDQIRPGELLRRLLRCLAGDESGNLKNRLIWLHDFK